MTNGDDAVEKTNIKQSNEKKVSINIATEKNKSNSDSNLNDEYCNIVLLYGYISVRNNCNCNANLYPLSHVYKQNNFKVLKTILESKWIQTFAFAAISGA